MWSLGLSRERILAIRHQWCGPTTVHLQYEFCLVIGLTLLTVSSLRGLYKESFGTTGDYVLICLVSLGVGRHLLVRLLSTWDPSTHATPTVTGCASHVLQSHVGAGQTYDRPASVQLALNRAGLAPNPAVDGSWIQWMPTSLVYASQIPDRWILFPISRAFANKWLAFRRYLRRYSSSSSGRTQSHHHHYHHSKRDSSATTSSWIRRSLNATKNSVLSLYSSYGPSIQFLLVMYVFLYCTSRLYYIRTGVAPSLALSGWSPVVPEKERTLILSINTQNNSLSDPKRRGAYRRTVTPTTDEVMFMILVFGTLSSLLLFYRIVLPVPDLVAGQNVLTDARAQARSDTSATGPSSSSSGGGGVSSSKKSSYRSSGSSAGQSGLFFSSSLPPARRDAVWSERQRPIQTEDRLHLTLHWIVLRLAENLLVCGLLPRTQYACRATGHCPAGPPLWELSRILHPVGVHRLNREDGLGAFGYMEYDIASLVWTMVGVAAITLTLLSAQTVVLDRTYLSIMGYIAGEWELVGKVESSSKKKSKKATSSGQQSAEDQLQEAPAWDSWRKYKRGDVVSYPATGQHRYLYKATANSPEGRPYNQQLGWVLSGFSKELGHPSTSEFLHKAALVQLCMVAVHVIFWFAAFVASLLSGSEQSYSSWHHRTFYGFPLACLAHVVAAHGLMTTAMGDHKELEQLNSEILAGVNRRGSFMAT